MSKFGIELSKEGDSVILSSDYTTNPKAFPFTQMRVVSIMGTSGSSEELMQALLSIPRRAKEITLILEDSMGAQKSVTITPQSVSQRIKDWFSKIPSNKPYTISSPRVQSPFMRYGLEATPDGKKLKQGNGRITPEGLERVFFH